MDKLADAESRWRMVPMVVRGRQVEVDVFPSNDGLTVRCVGVEEVTDGIRHAFDLQQCIVHKLALGSNEPVRRGNEPVGISVEYPGLDKLPGEQRIERWVTAQVTELTQIQSHQAG